MTVFYFKQDGIHEYSGRRLCDLIFHRNVALDIIKYNSE